MIYRHFGQAHTPIFVAIHTKRHMEINNILAKNRKRNEVLQGSFDPLTGDKADPCRELLEIPDFYLPRQYVPRQMLRVKLIGEIVRHGSIRKFIIAGLHRQYSKALHQRIAHEVTKIRTRYDFCFWAYVFVRIKNKLGGEDIPFRLNRPQRKLLSALETQRTAGLPIRLILLKARQWGGSTLVQMYMAWIQLLHKTNWNSIIVAHIKDTSSEIKGMYTKLLESYPAWMLDSPEAVKFVPFERSSNISIIPQTGCKVKLGTAEKPDSARGGDSSMAHMTEVAFWRKTEGKSPEEIIRSVCGGMATAPFTMQVYESTASGTGNFFHTEWERAKQGLSDKTPLFVSWFEIEMYQSPVANENAFARELWENRNHENGRYDWFLWQQGASLQNIAWYRQKRKEYGRHEDMMAEYPSDDIEAFQHSGQRVFDIYRIESLRRYCRPAAYTGEIHGKATKKQPALCGLHFESNTAGALKIWTQPESNIQVSDRYVAVVDVGGRSAKADYSVITVFDRYLMAYGGVPEIVAQWRGHTDHDRLAWKAAQIAYYYNKALLVIESNTYETENTDGEHTEYILDEIGSYYDNLYSRVPADQIAAGAPARWGFHTNISTKSMIIDKMVEIVRDELYIERDDEALNEARVYEKKPNGSYGAIDGRHDDILITRMIGLYICHTLPLPKEIKQISTVSKRNPVSEASM